jgi:hypothetical protein
MKTTICLFSIICLGLLSACSKSFNQSARHSVSSKTGFKKEAITVSLKKCKTIFFGNDPLKLCLDSVSDSRCPANAVCIWSGTAIAHLLFTKNEQVYPVTLAVPAFAPYQEKITLVGYTIKLIKVNPYPVLPPYPTPIESKKAEIEVSNC